MLSHFLGGMGELFWGECVHDGDGPVRFVCQRLKLNLHRLTVLSCIFNSDWLLLLSTILCPTQIPQSVHCVS